MTTTEPSSEPTNGPTIGPTIGPSVEPATAPAAATGPAFPWRFTAPLFIGSALNPVNTSLIATALVPISHSLGIRPGQTAALVTALYLACAVAQPTAGKVAEVVGPRRVFLAGIALVAAGGLVGGLAQNLATLLVSRVLIGLGTSCAYPTAMLLIRRRARETGLESPPGSVLGGLTISGVATASLGLPLGGVLVGLFGWRAVFWVNLPVALIALLAALAGVSPDGPVRRTAGLRDLAVRLDVTGILGFTAAMLSLLLFLFGLPTARWPLLAVSIALWCVLAGWELRARSPFLDVRMLAANRALTSNYLRFSLVMLCLYVVLYGLTQWVESARGVSETGSGLLLLPMTLVGGLVVAPLAKRNLVRGPGIAAAVTCLLGSAGVLLLSGSAWIGWVVLITILFGIGQGTAGAGSQTALYTLAPADQLGTASGLLRTFGYVGSIGASAITGLVFRTSVTDSGMHLIGWIMLGVSAVLILLTLATLSRPSAAVRGPLAGQPELMGAPELAVRPELAVQPERAVQTEPAGRTEPAAPPPSGS